jgi:predicted nuclease of restriction endonuclease-like (RecB) superfamily
MKVESEHSRPFYERSGKNRRASSRELDRQMSRLLFERLAMRRDEKSLMQPVI